MPASLLRAPFRGTEAVRAGLLSNRQLQAATWQRILPDIYLHTAVELTHRVRCQAAALWIGDRGAVSGRSAALLWGVDILPRQAPVEVTVPSEVRARSKPGLVIVRSTLPPSDISDLPGVCVTSPVRTAFDLARRLPFVEAVIALDALTSAALVDVGEVYRCAGERKGWRDITKIPSILAAVEPGAASPMETRLRLIIVGAGLPRPVAQHEVSDARGYFVGRLDLAYPDRKVGIEYEGDHHRDPATFRRDLQRTNRLRTLGWTILCFGPDDVLRHPERVITLVRRALDQDLT